MLGTRCVIAGLLACACASQGSGTAPAQRLPGEPGHVLLAYRALHYHLPMLQFVDRDTNGRFTVSRSAKSATRDDWTLVLKEVPAGSYQLSSAQFYSNLMISISSKRFAVLPGHVSYVGDWTFNLKLNEGDLDYVWDFSTEMVEQAQQAFPELMTTLPFAVSVPGEKPRLVELSGPGETPSASP